MFAVECAGWQCVTGIGVWGVSEGQRRVGRSRRRLGRYNEFLRFSTCWAYLDRYRFFLFICSACQCLPRVFCVFGAAQTAFQ